MSRTSWIGLGLAVLLAVALLFVVLRKAGGVTPASDGALSGHRLAEAWCTACHAIEANTIGVAGAAPDFVAVANEPSTTELSLKVFLRSSHPNMPNLVLTPEQTDDIVAYILSLRRK